MIDGNASASLVDLGDGVACVEFHSKMNSLGEGIIEMLARRVPTLVEKGGFRGWSSATRPTNFSVGADAFMILALAGQRQVGRARARWSARSSRR